MINLKTCFRCSKEKRIWATHEGNRYCQTCYIIAFPKKVLRGEKGLNAIKKKEKKETVYTLIKKLDEVYSKYIRLKGTGEDGLIECYTCGVRKPIGQMQCGHFYSRSHKSVRWCEDNTRNQCIGCNIFKKGNYLEFYPKLEKELGSEKFEKLRIKKENTANYGRFELKALITEYTQKVKQLENK